MKEKNKDLKKWADRADYECILAVNDNKNDTKNKDPYVSQSAGNQSAEFFRSAYGQAQSNSVDNVEIYNQSHTLQHPNVATQILPPQNSMYDRHSLCKRDGSYSEDLNGNKEQDNDFCRNIEINKYKLEYLVRKQNIIFDLYDKLYQKYV